MTCTHKYNIYHPPTTTFEDEPNHPPHRLERYMKLSEDIKPTIPRLPIPHHRYNQFYGTPIANTDVYIDDIIGIYQP
jgi:hypothetical protein